MKKLFLLIILITLSSKAQTLEPFQLEKIYKLKTLEKKCDYLYEKGFVKESSNNSQEVKLIKKKFIKRTQDFEIEAVKILNDTIVYLLNDPKSYVKFKQKIDYYYKEEPKSTNSLEINFKNRNEFFKVREIDNSKENNERSKFYSFTYFQEPKK